MTLDASWFRSHQPRALVSIGVTQSFHEISTMTLERGYKGEGDKRQGSAAPSNRTFHTF